MKKILHNFYGLRCLGVVLLVCLVSITTSFGQAVGDYGSNATGNWSAFATTWVVCVTNGTWTGATAATAVPATTTNVWIKGTNTVTANGSGSAYNCNNLTVESTATLTGAGTTLSPSYLRVYGTSIQIDGAMGTPSKVSLDLYNPSTTTPTTISSTGSTALQFGRVRNNVTGTALVINANIDVTYAGTTAASTGGGLVPNNLAYTVTINVNKTLRTAQGSYIAPSTSGSNDGNAAAKSYTMNVYGTIITGSSSLSLGGATTGTALNLGNQSGMTTTLNIFNGGTVTVNGDVNAPATSLATAMNIKIESTGTPGVLTATGAYNIAGASVEYAGTSALNSIASLSSVKNLNITNATGVTLSSAIAVSSGLTLSTGKLTMGTYVVSGAGTFTVSSGTTLESGHTGGIAGNNTTLGTQTLSMAANYTFNGSSAQVTSASLPATVNNLTINNAAGVTLTAGTTVAGALSLTTGTLNVNGQTLTIGGTVSVGGNLLASGTGSNVVITGPSTFPSGLFSGTALANLNINKAAGVTMIEAFTVTNGLTLTLGNLTLGANDLTVNGTITGGSMSSHVVTNSLGSLKTVFTGGDTKTFPIGATAGSYDPLSITPTNAITFGARVKSSITNALANATPAVQREWDLSPSATPGSTNLAFTPDAAALNMSNTPSASAGVVAHWNGINWDGPLATAYSGGTWTLTGYAGSFSPFIVAAPEVVLSVELTNITAKANGNVNTLNWSTASEKNNKEFQIERSINGINFTSIGTVKGSGTMAKATTYIFTDDTPLSINYYRLVSVDFDGKKQTSNIVSVFRSTSGKLKVYPTLASDKLTVLTSDNEPAVYSIVNLLGKVVQTGLLNTTELTVSGLATGTYLLKVGSEVVKFVKN